MNKKNAGQPLSKKVEVDQEFQLADDYVDEYSEAKVTLVEEENETYDIAPPESNKTLVPTQAYTRKKQFASINQAQAEEIKPTSFQPGLLIRRLKRG